MKVEQHHETCIPKGRALKDEIKEALKRVPSNLKRRPILPWVGRNYGRGGRFGKRILVLGNSGYEWCPLCHKRGRSDASLAGLTCYNVAARVLRHRMAYKRHWPSIELALLGGHAVDEDRRQVWHSIAYANYIPGIVGWEGQAPTPAMWEEAERGYSQLLEALRPNLVFVLGEEVWKRLPPECTKLGALRKNSRKVFRCVYRLKNGNDVIACRLHHPRAGLGAPWQPVVAQAIHAA